MTFQVAPCSGRSQWLSARLEKKTSFMRTTGTGHRPQSQSVSPTSTSSHSCIPSGLIHNGLRVQRRVRAERNAHSTPTNPAHQAQVMTLPHPHTHTCVSGRAHENSSPRRTFGTFAKPYLSLSLALRSTQTTDIWTIWSGHGHFRTI